jgi:hypothetical protein
MYLSTHHPSAGSKCSTVECERVARFQIQFPTAHDSKHLCSACLARCVEVVFLLKEIIEK